MMFSERFNQTSSPKYSSLAQDLIQGHCAFRRKRAKSRYSSWMCLLPRKQSSHSIRKGTSLSLPIWCLFPSILIVDDDKLTLRLLYRTLDINGYKCTLASDAAKGATTVTVTSATGFTANDEISIGTGATVDEADSTLEHCVISSIAGNVLTLKRKLGFAHATGQYVTEGADVYPTILFGANPVIGCGIGLDPEVRVMPPSDDLGRLHRAGWYSIIGWDCLDSDAAEIIYTRASTTNLSMSQML